MFKRKIKQFVDQRIKEIKKHQSQTQQIHFDYSQISKLFPEPNFIPLTSWAISPSTILHMLNDVVINNRQSIIEFGSGASTLYIAQLIKVQNLNTRFYSVESDEIWIEKMKNELKKLDLEDQVNFILAPLKEVAPELRLNEQTLWYDTEKISKALNGKSESIDLVIVDGPYGGSTPFARYSALPFIKTYLKKDFSVFLDDIHRSEEKIILQEWKEILGLKPIRFKRYGYFITNSSFSIQPFKI